MIIKTLLLQNLLKETISQFVKKNHAHLCSETQESKAMWTLCADIFGLKNNDEKPITNTFCHRTSENLTSFVYSPALIGTIRRRIKNLRTANFLPEGQWQKPLFHYKTLTCLQESVRIGNLLGDGHIESRDKRNFSGRFVLSQKATRLEYVEYLCNVYKNYLSLETNWPRLKIDRLAGKEFPQWYFKTKDSPIFAKYRRDWYSIDNDKPMGEVIVAQKKHKKIVPLDISLDALSVAIWYADDGKFCAHGGQIFCSECFLYKEQQILCDSLKKNLGIKCFVKPYKVSNRNIEYIHQITIKGVKNSNYFREKIGPHMAKFLLYKIQSISSARKAGISIPSTIDK